MLAASTGVRVEHVSRLPHAIYENSIDVFPYAGNDYRDIIVLSKSSPPSCSSSFSIVGKTAQ